MGKYGSDDNSIVRVPGDLMPLSDGSEIELIESSGDTMTVYIHKPGLYSFAKGTITRVGDEECDQWTRKEGE